MRLKISDKTSYDQPVISSYYKDPLTGYTVVVSDNYNDALKNAVSAAMVTVLIGLVFLVIAVFLSLKTASSFTEPIKAVNRSLSELAEGKFEKINKFAQRKDEFGAMVNNTNSVIGKLEGIVSHIKESAEHVNSSSLELSEMTNQISKTTEDVAHAVQEIASGATLSSTKMPPPALSGEGIF